MNDTIKSVRKSLTLTEIGVIVSLLTSAGVGVFTLGVIYGQVGNNTDRINAIEPKVEGVVARIERIDANVAFLTELAKEDRDRHR
ncbi:hypothetical protein [Parasphingorhabdus sp.]|uniref:hypothetical protein n=1 Tax=Parasphingorhabdus sp. TaxID=2709688 RepID=UPI003A8F61F5